MPDPSVELLRRAATKIRDDPREPQVWSDWFESDARQLEDAGGRIASCDEPGSIERSIELARAILGDTA